MGFMVIILGGIGTEMKKENSIFFFVITDGFTEVQKVKRPDSFSNTQGSLVQLHIL
jgi:hypothetical protein